LVTIDALPIEDLPIGDFPILILPTWACW